MPWEKDAVRNIEYYKQDSQMGCAFSCLASAANWFYDKKLTEDDFRKKAVGGGITFDADASKSTSGSSLELFRALAGTVPLVTEAKELDEQGLKEVQVGASQDGPVLLGVLWNDGSQHLVLCVGKDATATDKVVIVDPGIGTHTISPGLVYKPTGYDGKFDGRAVEIHYGG